MDKGKMIASPGLAFPSVQDLMDNTILSKEEKITALLNWKDTCEQIKESTNEGMPGERTTRIADVLAALRVLQE